jgi:hypothetical protein
MESPASLQLIARVSYYIGWLSALCGAATHFIAPFAAALSSINIETRNMFEASVLFFLISIASMLRAGASK